VATPWADERVMRDDALVEAAVADALPAGTKVSELADLQFEGDAHSAANDLSLADGRFSPDVLEIAARRAVEARGRQGSPARRDLRPPPGVLHAAHASIPAPPVPSAGARVRDAVHP